MSFDAVLPTRRVRDRIRGKPVRERQLRQHEKLRAALHHMPPQRAKGLGTVLRAVVELTNRDGQSAHEPSLTADAPHADTSERPTWLKGTECSTAYGASHARQPCSSRRPAWP